MQIERMLKMKRYLVGYNECGEMKEIEVEVGCDTLGDFAAYIDDCIENNCHFIILTAVIGDFKKQFAIRPKNIEEIVELNC